MNHSGATLSQFFSHHRQAGTPLVLATIAETLGSTYRKAGAQMLIAPDGSAAGLLSGGCLEADLMERARSVLESGEALAVEYDTRSSDDILWGIGLGCEGAMRIILTRLDASNDYQPFAHVEQARHDNIAARFALVVSSENSAYRLGAAFRGHEPNIPAPVADVLRANTSSVRTQSNSATVIELDRVKFLIVSIALPIQLLLLGAGPDAMPVVEFAAMLDWHVCVLDHRPAYAVQTRFPRAKRVVAQSVNQLETHLQTSRYDAAVVMSHHLTSDAGYLAALAHSAIPYVGLLGPAPRRARLMSDIGSRAEGFHGRLHGPIGLDIGATSPETIALAIVSEIQAVLAGRSGRSFSETSDAPQPAR
jgi:xanthine/CO dehydrogenase XdhC/CoxF family maturation factor